MKLKAFYLWHRYTGLVAAILVLLLAVTGLLLNHTDRLQLERRHVQVGWILDWYGIRMPDEVTSYALGGGRHLTRVGRHLYLDERELEGEYQTLIGAVALPDLIAVAADDQILLLTPEGELIERLTGAEGVPAGMRKLGTTREGRLLVAGAHALYAPDEDFLRWEHWTGDPATTEWVRPGPLPERLRAALEAHYRGEILPWERVILDWHSGRFFGRYGPWVMDAAAVLLILLAASGSWIFLRIQIKRHQHHERPARKPGR